MKCSYCGAEIKASDAAFCPECGHRFPSAPPKIQRLGQKRQRADAAPRHYGWVLAAAAVLVILIGSVITFAVYFDFTTEDWSNLLRQSERVPSSVPSLHDVSAEHSGITTPAPAPTADDGDASQSNQFPEASEEERTEATPAPAFPEGQEPVAMVTLPGGTQAPAADFIFPYSGSQALILTDLDSAFAGLSSTDAALLSQQAINEIYARYGYRFHPELSDSAQWASQYFGTLSWYNDIVCDSWSNTGEVPINRTESANIDLIVEWQVNHGCR